MRKEYVMTSEELQSIHAKLDAIQNLTIVTHREEFAWVQAINNRQVMLEKKLGLTDASMPFEPFYNRAVGLSGSYPEIFNKYGERMEVFFISDRHFAHAPNNKNSRYVIWDRYNYGLDTHFYTNDKIFEVVGNPKRKFALMCEQRSIAPKDFERVVANRDYIEKNFDAIFTYDVEILNTFKNAKFIRPGSVLYGLNAEGNMADGQAAGFSNDGELKAGVVISEDNCKRKTKNISMICSQKEMCPMHILRKKLAFRLITGRGC